MNPTDALAQIQQLESYINTIYAAKHERTIAPDDLAAATLLLNANLNLITFNLGRIANALEHAHNRQPITAPDHQNERDPDTLDLLIAELEADDKAPAPDTVDTSRILLRTARPIDRIRKAFAHEPINPTTIHRETQTIRDCTRLIDDLATDHARQANSQTKP